jgi:hypothetical protein
MVSGPNGSVSMDGTDQINPGNETGRISETAKHPALPNDVLLPGESMSTISTSAPRACKARAQLMPTMPAPTTSVRFANS